MDKQHSADLDTKPILADMEATADEVTRPVHEQAVATARRGALWIAGGGVVTAATYFGADGNSYWIFWGPMAYGAFVLLRGLGNYFAIPGWSFRALSVTALLTAVGLISASAVLEAERELSVLSGALDESVAQVKLADARLDDLEARGGSWSVVDVQDTLAVSDFYAKAASTIDSARPPLARAFPRLAVADTTSALFRKRSELARGIGLATTPEERKRLMAEFNATLKDRGGAATTPLATQAAARTPTATATAAPTLVPTPRPVALRPDQVIVPAARFPFSGYEVTLDEARGSWGWLRSFDSRSGTYYFVVVIAYVFGATDEGTTVVGAFDCSTYADPEKRPVKTTALTAEVVGDGAKACRYDIGTEATVYGYIAGSRNVAVRIEANPRVQTTDATAMRDLVNLARLQLQIIDAVAPR